MRIPPRNPTTPAPSATKPDFSKGIVRTPQRPRGKECIEIPGSPDTTAVRDFAQRRMPVDGWRERLATSTRGLARAFGGDDKDRSGLRGGRGSVEDAARAEAGGQRGALWERLREVIDNLLRDRRGTWALSRTAPGVPPPDDRIPPMSSIPTREIRKNRPDIIRTPVTSPRTKLPS